MVNAGAQIDRRFIGSVINALEESSGAKWGLKYNNSGDIIFSPLSVMALQGPAEITTVEREEKRTAIFDTDEWKEFRAKLDAVHGETRDFMWNSQDLVDNHEIIKDDYFETTTGKGRYFAVTLRLRREVSEISLANILDQAVKYGELFKEHLALAANSELPKEAVIRTRELEAKYDRNRLLSENQKKQRWELN